MRPRKTFIFDWRDHGRQRRVTIGKFPTWTIGKARTQASKLRLKADTGETVAPGRGERVVDLITAWKEVVRLTRRPGTVMSYFSLIDDHIIPAFGHFDPRAISRNGVEKWHAEIAQKTPISANRAMAVLSAFLTWLENDERIERNVARRLRRQPESARHTFLNADEITAAHTALDADRDRNAALALRLLLLTGARVGEVLTMKSEQIDLSRKVWIKPASNTKTKRVHIVPLQPEALSVALELLDIGLPAYHDCRSTWYRIKAILGRPEVRVHDLRHSRASALARSGASLMQIGKVLGHSAPQTTSRYAHLVDVDLVALVERTS